MPDILIFLIYALLPAFGNLAGALLAESVRPPRWVIGAALHGAAGIAIALISIELMPRILKGLPMWAIATAFLAGAIVSFAMARGVRIVQSSGQDDNNGAKFRAWMVYAAIGADLFSDGMMTGAGGAVALNLGFLLAAAQLVANIPGGFAATANLRQYNVQRKRRIIISAAMFTPVLISALFGFAVLRSAPPAVQSAALAFIVGVLLLATIEDMVPEGDAPRPPRWSSTLAFSLGFTGLMLLSSYLSV